MVRFFALSGMLLGLSFILIACGGDNDAVATPTVLLLSAALLEEGQTVYMSYCAECHGPEGEGQNPEAPLTPDDTGRYPAPPHNDTGHTWHHDDDLLIQIIKEGGMGGEAFHEMPAFGDQLSDQEINAVLVYIKTMWTDEQRQFQQERTEAVRQQR